VRIAGKEMGGIYIYLMIGQERRKTGYTKKKKSEIGKVRIES
jgi:hypothetical protein